MNILIKWNDLGRSAIAGESPLHASRSVLVCILSRGGPEKSPLNPAAPSAKAKYSLETDSALVP
jgi:hypothetical protein